MKRIEKVEGKIEIKEKDELRREVDSSVLIAIPYRGEEGVLVRYVTDEFTSLCPWSGLPDFGKVEIAYVPGEWLVELKSLKYYLLSFRNARITQEEAVSRIFKDLNSLLEAKSLKVKIEFVSRGGIRTIVEKSK